ncbi:uncharacterized protein LOC130813918 isoform X2 [Amaranthus tricolor]|uniref:uncharacterized protein LOC130813918 isoform X2 n=1 Tax=Amaranthus tricolor TaxID=29722 RepID=UPI00258D9699|nr:uncharacterized protein LOC130813918 isoform X2 [Amaranthus tricolor]
MAITVNELLNQWRAIEEENEDVDDCCSDSDDITVSSKINHIQQAKENWFTAAYNFLICLPEEHHVWCGFWDIMGPFLETFFNFFKVEGDESLLKNIWARVSREMRRCTECISRHHQAQEMYKCEYESSFISPLLSILQYLDEERVFEHLKEANARLAFGGYDVTRDNTEIVCLMFEVLTFPVLMEDDAIANEFQKLIEAVDDVHELALAKQQHFPGVYALLFLKSRKSRSIGHRLAGNLGKLSSTAELEPLQPLLKRGIGFLAGDVVQSSSEILRPRVQMDRLTIWLGLKALLAFLEPPALEDGILEPYPVFLNFVLDHISDDSAEFSHAVNCMRLLFEILGCKLWLRTSLPPSVMRDSLLSQCFHTRNEKTHKEIFDLLQPLLQSLESLHDGEFEKQRRHIIYFLLHQVTRSSNFSILMRKKACQIALLLVRRGYKMNPPSPPYECAHMWGPSLVSSLKDTTLHTSLRQPAIDLIQTIIVSDATALLSSLLHCQTPTVDHNISFELNEETDDINSSAPLVEEKHVCCWNDFTFQSNIVCQEYTEWMCVPMLWFDVLVEIECSILPISIANAVLWALSRFSMVEPENPSELSLPVKTWLSSCAAEVSAFVGWKSPTGSDDSGDGKTSKNSVRVSTMCIPLIRTLRRLAAHFIIQVEQGDLQKQWTWEPPMGDSLILLLSDPNDNVRQSGRRILEQVSGTRGLTSGLQFLCCSRSSLTAIRSGLKHALILVQLDSVLVNFQSLHHFFFVLSKIFKEGFSPPTYSVGNSSGEPNLKFASQGGFLRQTSHESLNVIDNKEFSKVKKELWKSFSSELAECAWLPVKKCVHKGKAFMDYKISLMSCVRLLEILPIIFREISQSPDGFLGKFLKMDGLSDFSWLHDLADWGKSSLNVVLRYWKQSMSSLLSLLKSSCNEKSGSIVTAIEKLIASDAVPMDSLTEQVSHLSISLSDKGSCMDKSDQKLKSPPDGLSAGKKSSFLDVESSVQMSAVATMSKKSSETVIILSDEETDTSKSLALVLDDTKPIEDDVVARTADKAVSQVDIENKTFGSDIAGILSEAFEKKVSPKDAIVTPMSQKPVVTKHVLKSSSLTKIKDKEIIEKDINFKSVTNECISPLDKARVSSSEVAKPKHPINAQKKKVAVLNDPTLKEIVRDIEDPLELALKSAGRNHSLLKKQGPSLPKRRVIQLADPVESRSAYLRKLEAAAKRFKPPNMDEWFKPILEMDYFVSVGLATAYEEENKTHLVLKEIPVSFQSHQQYIDIFRPLVLEEFKAQILSSFQEVSSLEDMPCGGVSVVSIERIDDFHLVRCVHDEHGSAISSSCLENDLVLLTKQPLKYFPHKVHLVGKVERREKDSKKRLNMLLIRFYLQSGSSRVNIARKQLLERSKWYLSRIMSITPQLREFQALSSVEVIPALPIILRPSDHAHPSGQLKKVDLSKLSQLMQQVLKSTFNESQIQAISAVVKDPDSRNDFDLSLVQGPPGTGKTRTIVALISALLAVSSWSNAMDKQSGGSLQVKSTPYTNFRKSISESVAIARAWQDAALARQLNDNAEKDTKMPKASARKRVLVCAQSNAAVDELVSRLAGEGLYGIDGNMYKPYLVRVGNSKTVHPNSLPFFIDTLVEHRLTEEKMVVGDGKDNSSDETSTMIRESLEKVLDRIKFYESKRANLKDEGTEENDASLVNHLEVDNGKKLSSSELEARLRSLYRQKKEIYTQLAVIQAREKKVSVETKALRIKLRRSILKEAEIVVTTLSGCGGDLYSACFEFMSKSKMANLIEQNLFDAVVIDEAAQALEPATLIPLQLLKSSGTKCIMVGDPKQLPATVLSNVASRYMYECSMFERLQRAGYPVIMLTEQYRMHPEICHFPSLHFYDGKLLNGVPTSSKTAPFHKTSGLGPYVFYDVRDGQECYGKNSGSSSLYNEGEADAAIELVKNLQKRYPSEFVGERIGIITPYKSQLSLLRSRFSNAFGSSVSSEIEFNTVDGFQGREVDILILSTVRSSNSYPITPKMNSSSIGFVADIRRMNVALTRARLSLWILGNARTLEKNSDWAALLEDARERNLIISVKRPYKAICENILGKTSDTKDSGDCCGVMSEVNPYPMQVESNHDSCRRKSKYKEMKHGRTKSPVTEVLEIFKREVDIRGKRKKQTKQLQILEDRRTSGKKIKESGVDKTEQEASGLGEISNPLGSSEDVHIIEKTVKETRNVHQLEHENSGVKKMSDTLGSQGFENSLRHPKSQEDKVALGSYINCKLRSKDIDGRGQSSNEIERPKDLISKRKQQREAVDALLSSSLLPSKKSETSTRGMAQKRAVSSSSKSGAFRPTKQQRGTVF